MTTLRCGLDLVSSLSCSSPLCSTLLPWPPNPHHHLVRLGPHWTPYPRCCLAWPHVSTSDYLVPCLECYTESESITHPESESITCPKSESIACPKSESIVGPESKSISHSARVGWHRQWLGGVWYQRTRIVGSPCRFEAIGIGWSCIGCQHGDGRRSPPWRGRRSARFNGQNDGQPGTMRWWGVAPPQVAKEDH